MGVATTRPDGKVSLKLTPVSESVEFGLVMVMLREVVPPTGIDDAPKDMATVGRCKAGVGGP